MLEVASPTANRERVPVFLGLIVAPAISSDDLLGVIVKRTRRSLRSHGGLSNRIDYRAKVRGLLRFGSKGGSYRKAESVVGRVQIGECRNWLRRVEIAVANQKAPQDLEIGVHQRREAVK